MYFHRLNHFAQICRLEALLSTVNPILDEPEHEQPYFLGKIEKIDWLEYATFSDRAQSLQFNLEIGAGFNTLDINYMKVGLQI